MTPVVAVNPLVRRTAFPAILEARTWLAAYDGSRGPALDLSQATPPYPPPPGLLTRLSAAAGDAETARYGKVPGEDKLREAYAAHVSQLYGTPVGTESVAITAGANQAFSIAATLVAARGDAVVLPLPWYFNHQMTLDLLGIDARPLPCGRDFLPDPAALDALIDERVRAVVLVTPNNPTGAIYPPALIADLAGVCRARGVWLIIDETYRDFLPDGGSAPHTLFHPATRDGVIGVYSFSKSLAIPGHRLGAMVFPPAIAADVTKIQDCLQICPPRAAQIAVTWGLEQLGGWRDEKRRFFVEQASAFRTAMRSASGWQVASTGGYFAFVQHPYGEQSSLGIAERLARENGVLCLPGTYFGPGGEAYLRVSIGGLSGEALTSFAERLRLD